MDGILIVDKPRGITSRQVVTKLGRRIGVEKIGHAGTLDPLATGVLVVCVGRGTLLSIHLAAQGKRYTVDALLGVATDTYDIDGNIKGGSTVIGLGLGKVQSELESFKGSIMQKPPPYSAVKYNGKPLYYYARRGIEVAPRPRKVSVESIDVVSFEKDSGGTHLVFEISCSSGTYIRSIVHELGCGLGCGACVYSLRRTSSGDFSENSAVPLERLLSLDLEALIETAVSLERATESLPGLSVTADGDRAVALGKPLLREWISGRCDVGEGKATFRVLDAEGHLIALYGPPRHDDGPEILGRAVRVLRPEPPVPRRYEAT